MQAQTIHTMQQAVMEHGYEYVDGYFSLLDCVLGNDEVYDDGDDYYGGHQDTDCHLRKVPGVTLDGKPLEVVTSLVKAAAWLYLEDHEYAVELDLFLEQLAAGYFS